MSDELYFIPWVRHGLGALIPRNSPVPVTARPVLRAQVRLGSGKVSTPVPFEIYGPGDVAGLSKDRVARCEPQPNTDGFIPSWMPFIEFDQADFPWLVTPLPPDAKEHLIPWLTLLALEESEARLLDQTVPAIQVTSVASLPDLSSAWAWAHVQVLAPAAQDRAQIGAFIERHPERAVARLVCPRRLRPGTRYVALVVPTFLAGVQGGLGQKVTAAAGALAWTSTIAGPITLPVYHQWSFRTGILGDFEDLIRKLQARPLADAGGMRALATDRAGHGLPAATLNMQGALRPGSSSPAAATAYETPLLDLLNRKATQAPAVPPPIYGGAHAAQDGLPSSVTAAQAAWLRELNLDPRHRLAASLGVDLVKKRQETLMAAAWSQYGEIEKANHLIRQAQLASQANEHVHAHLAAVARSSPTDFLALARPVMNVISWGAAGGSLASTLRALPGVRGVLSPAFYRVARERGPIRRRTLPGRNLASEALAEVLGGGQVVERGATRAPDGQPFEGTIRPPVSACQVGNELAPPLVAPAATVVRAGVVAPADIKRMVQEVIDHLAPSRTAPRAVASRVDVPAELRPDGALDLIRAAPQFGTPIYRWLCEEDKRWLAPGVDGLPDNAVTALVPNPKFIEALLVGMNHEMARELLWRGFPADGRGTSFRQFWETWDRQKTPVQLRPDLPADIRDWKPSSKLGDHLATGAGGTLTVLLVRGEALRQCPDLLIYCTQAAVAGDKRSLKTNGARLFPVFTAAIPPDTTLLAFEVPAETMVGTATDPGYFFVFEQPPAGLHLGLDTGGTGTVPGAWSNLSWEHVGAGKEGAFASVATAVSPTQVAAEDARRWGPDAHAGMVASLLLKKPFRVAFHAASLLVPQGS